MNKPPDPDLSTHSLISPVSLPDPALLCPLGMVCDMGTPSLSTDSVMILSIRPVLDSRSASLLCLLGMVFAMGTPLSAAVRSASLPCFFGMAFAMGTPHLSVAARPVTIEVRVIRLKSNLTSRKVLLDLSIRIIMFNCWLTLLCITAKCVSRTHCAILWLSCVLLAYGPWVWPLSAFFRVFLILSAYASCLWIMSSVLVVNSLPRPFYTCISPSFPSPGLAFPLSISMDSSPDPPIHLSSLTPFSLSIPPAKLCSFCHLWHSDAVHP